MPRMSPFHMREHRLTRFLLQACGKPSSITAVDDEIQNVSSFSPGISPSASPSPTYDIRDSLPPGWKKSSNSSGSRTTFILVLSLVLAFVICFLIIGLVFWRKSRHRKHQQGDVEMKARRRRRDIPADEDREGMVQKDIKQKIWARATARWKANVRYTARQRRGKRIVPTSRVTPKTSFVSLEQSQFRTSSATSPPLSHRTSIESLYSNSPAAAAITSDPAPGQNEDQIQPSLASTSSHRLSCTSPPAYHQRLTRPQDPSPTEVLSDDPIPSSPSPFHAQRPSSSSGGSSGLDPSPYASLELSPIHAAHVATDDKSLLARLAELASSPPPSQEPVPADAQPSTPQVSAPVWQDEEFEDFPCDPGGSSSSRSPSPVLLFPPPPSKGKMAAPAFYDYSYSFEDIILKSEAGPSAPPFDDPPSAPPTDNIDLTPSAPPLMETDYYMEFHAAAPLHDDSLLHHRLEQEESHDQEVVIPSDSRPQTDMSVSDMDSFSTRVEGPVSSDGIPPRYYP